jgi:hypothetical protein
MTRNPDRAREDRARGAARRQGLRLVKSRRRDRASPDFGRYALADDEDHLVFTGDPELNYGATLAEVEAWLRSGAWPRLRRERESAAAARMSKGDLGKTAGNPSRSTSRSPRNRLEARPGARPEDETRPEARSEGRPGDRVALPEALIEELLSPPPRSRLLPWRNRANGAGVITMPPDEDEFDIWKEPE